MKITLTEILKELTQLENPFDLTKHNLGSEAALIAATEMYINMDQECDPLGMPWEPLSQRYAKWKSAIAPGAPMAVLTHHMKDILQLVGSLLIHPMKSVQTYGLDELAKIHAMKFQMGGTLTGTAQPEREFWGFTYDAIMKIDALMTTRLEAAMR